MSELHDQLARVKLHMGVGSCSSFVSRQQFTGVRPLFQTFPVSAVFRPKPAANQRRVLQEARVTAQLLRVRLEEAGCHLREAVCGKARTNGSLRMAMSPDGISYRCRLIFPRIGRRRPTVNFFEDRPSMLAYYAAQAAEFRMRHEAIFSEIRHYSWLISIVLAS